MARSRLELQQTLRTIAPKAWFKRPPDNKMTYPCIIYRQSRPRALRANNKAYHIFPCWNVIYIDTEPSETITQTMMETFPHCDFDREYETDNLYHYSFTIYY